MANGPNIFQMLLVLKIAETDVCTSVYVLAVYMDAEDEQLLEDEVAVPTDSKRSVHFMYLQHFPYKL